MTQNGRVFVLKFTVKSVSQTVTLLKGKNMPATSPPEKEESTSIPTKMVATTAPPMGKDVTNKAAEDISSKGNELVDGEA